jgi:hypothetical protein
MGNRRVISGNAGKYDEVAERLMRDLKADACVLIVRNGRLGGNGMSCAVDPSKPGGIELATGWAMPELLRRMADMIEAGIAEGHGPDGITIPEGPPEGN